MPSQARAAAGSGVTQSKANMKVTIAPEPFDSADAQRLIEALDAHLASRYSPEQRFGPNLKPAQLATGLGAFVVARMDGRAVGCGAVRLLDTTTVEVKRMYVEPEMRGRGIGNDILAHLEDAGRELGARRAVLETGIYQDEAIGLYRRAGYSVVDCWGEYKTSPTSVCYEKAI
jgi:putative acetyltransferase